MSNVQTKAKNLRRMQVRQLKFDKYVRKVQRAHPGRLVFTDYRVGKGERH